MPSGVYKRKIGTKYGMTGRHHSEEARKKMRDTRIRKGLAEGANNPNWKDGRSFDRKDYYKERDKKRRQDPKYCLNHSVTTAIWFALKGNKAGRHWEDLVGYTLQELMIHLENLFEPWMTWENYGEWHIDHKRPQSLFNYETAEDTEFQECWALANLQPLEATVNIKKSNHYKIIK